MRRGQDFTGKGNGRVEPMPGNADITVLAIQPVNLHPIDKAIARSGLKIGQH